MTQPAITMAVKPGRRGSDAAATWARNLCLRLRQEGENGRVRWISTGVPAVATKCVLLALTQYVNAEGACCPSIATLSEDTEMSWESVKRRLADLEYLGIVARFRRWRDPNGVLNSEGRGRETSGEIRFLFDTTQEDVDAKLQARITGEAVPDDAEPEDLGAQPEHPNDDGDPSPVSTPGAQYCAPLVNLHLKEDSPQSPPDPEIEEGLTRFKSAYPIPSNRPEQVKALWEALRPAEREQARRGAEGVRVIRTKEPKRPVVDPAKFLRNPDLWAEYTRFAPPPAAVAPQEYFTATGTSEWHARAVKAAICGLPMPRAGVERDGRLGALFRSPVTPDVAALAEFVDVAGGVDTSGWVIVHKHPAEGDERLSAHYAAWCERIKEWTGQWPEGDRIWVDGEGQPVATVAKAAKRLSGARKNERGELVGGFEVPCCIVGLRVPTEWPPSKAAIEHQKVG